MLPFLSPRPLSVSCWLSSGAWFHSTGFLCVFGWQRFFQVSIFCPLPLVFPDVCISWVSSDGSPLSTEKLALQIGPYGPAHCSCRLTWHPRWLHEISLFPKGSKPPCPQLTDRGALQQSSPCSHKPLIHVAGLTRPCAEASHFPSGEGTWPPPASLQSRVCVFRCGSCCGAILLQAQLVPGLLNITRHEPKKSEGENRLH